jgi:hypothetical protein
MYRNTALLQALKVPPVSGSIDARNISLLYIIQQQLIFIHLSHIWILSVF